MRKPRSPARQDTEYKKEVSGLKRLIEKLCAWFPLAKEILRVESLCHLIGFDERQTVMLISGEPLIYAGELYSEEHKRKFTVENVTARIAADDTDRRKLTLKIDKQPIGEWFKEEFEKIRLNIRRLMQPQWKSKGFKL